MGCNRDSNCLSIVNNTYPYMRLNIEKYMNDTCNQIVEIEEKLKELDIPEDYLGSKIKDKLERLYTDLDKDIEFLNEELSNIESFIDRRKEEHYNHYIVWLETRRNKSKGGDVSEL